MTDVILPGSPPRGNIKGCANHFSSSSRFPTGQQQDKASQHDKAQTLFPLPRLLAEGQSQPTWQRTHSFLHFLAAGRTSQHERSHSLFFTDSSSLSLSLCLTHISSSPLSTMRRPHQIFGPLVSGKSSFHHSSFLLNQRILGETNWIFSTPAFNFSILIPVLTTASQLLLWHSTS